MPRTAKGRKTKKKPIKFKTNKKCIFTEQNIEYIDYKDVEVLKKFISYSNGKILSRRIKGVSSKHQRRLALAIKRAREVGLLPFVGS